MAHANQHGTAAAGGHEERDVRLRPLLIGLLGVVGLVVATFLLMALVQRVVTGAADARAAGKRPRVAMRELPPEPRLQPRPVEDLHALEAEQDAILNSYGWVDRERGVVRIPIDRAMALVAERGLPHAAGEEARP